MKNLCLALLLTVAVVSVSPFTARAASDAPASVDQLKEQIIDLENAGTLSIEQFTLCSKIGGFGQCEAVTGTKVTKGTELLFYYEPKNSSTQRSGDTYRRWFTQDMIVRDSTGKELLRKDQALEFNYKTKRPVMDVFVQNTLTLGDLPAGNYSFEAVLHDQLSKQTANHVFKFEIGN